MFPCLIKTLIINVDYHFILSFYSTTPAWLYFLEILLSHDNPGDFINGFFKFCNWNVNSLAKDNFERIQLLEAHTQFLTIPLVLTSFLLTNLILCSKVEHILLWVHIAIVVSTSKYLLHLNLLKELYD